MSRVISIPERERERKRDLNICFQSSRTVSCKSAKMQYRWYAISKEAIQHKERKGKHKS